MLTCHLCLLWKLSYSVIALPLELRYPCFHLGKVFSSATLKGFDGGNKVCNPPPNTAPKHNAHTDDNAPRAKDKGFVGEFNTSFMVLHLMVVSFLIRPVKLYLR